MSLDQYYLREELNSKEDYQMQIDRRHAFVAVTSVITGLATALAFNTSPQDAPDEFYTSVAFSTIFGLTSIGLGYMNVRDHIRNYRAIKETKNKLEQLTEQ